MGDVVGEIAEIVGNGAVDVGVAIREDDTHDECLTVPGVRPIAVVRPTTTEQVAAAVACCRRHGVPVTARGSGSGLSGGAVGAAHGVVVCFDRMARILEVDTANHVAVVQPGATLAQLDEALAAHGLVYPVEPGEPGASLGGTVATNAGGMRAVRYGVTRNHVLGLELVLADGTVLRTGGKLAKQSSGYDLTQLVIGSEGTLALVTEAILRVRPRPGARATLLAPFARLDELAAAIPALVGSGIDPLVLEYLDMVAMAGVTQAAGMELAVAPEVRDRAMAYLVVGLQARTDQQLADDVEAAGALLDELHALDVYVLQPTAAADLITARERAFYAAKAAGADDVVDMVVPRAAIPDLLSRAATLAAESGSLVTGCGHAGDGNVHLSVFQPDAGRRHDLLDRLFRAAVALGGAISGEHGIGRAKRQAFAALADPVQLALLRGIKAVFDPDGILGPGVGPPEAAAPPQTAPPQAAAPQTAPPQAAAPQAAAPQAAAPQAAAGGGGRS